MPTDDERREIARKLRAIDPDDFSSYSEEAYVIDNALGIWEDSCTYIFHYLADFIDPEPERMCHVIGGEVIAKTESGNEYRPFQKYRSLALTK